MIACKAKRILRIILDVILYASIGTFLAISLMGLIPPTHTRVSCDDPSIRMPYHPNTVSVKVLLIITLGFPLIMISALEYLVPPASDCRDSQMHLSAKRSFHYILNFLVGAMLMFFTNDLIKTLSGEPRPLFWSVCAPNITEEQCKQGSVGVTWKDCTNPMNFSRSKVVDSMKSFPSGHASLTVFSSIFMIVYIKQRLWNKCSSLAVPWFQLVWVSWTVFCCQSRIWDNWHHWWDVVAGIALGAFGALLTLQHLSHWFIREGDFSLRGLGDPNYESQEERTSSFSGTRTSIKRLISTNSDTDNHLDPRLDNRELTDINGTP